MSNITDVFKQSPPAAMPLKRKPAPLAVSLEADPFEDVVAVRGEGTYDCPKKRLRYNAALYDSSNESVAARALPRSVKLCIHHALHTHTLLR